MIESISINNMMQFAGLILKFQDVTRAVDLKRGVLRENDVEHSYHLAMMAWYLNSSGKWGYDVDKLIRYALVHDIAEAYTGDVHAFNVEARKGKDEREAIALEQIVKDIPNVAPLIEIVHTYEQQADEESRCIYALDKLMPMLMIYMNDGVTWHREGLTWPKLHANKVAKVAVSPPVAALYSQLATVLDNQPQLFPESQKDTHN